ncbi:cecr1 family adenosine deaminase [Sporothrix brasiliensis 5110]|uniref:adenosine deaminase n=1 Tax=Sporothrix brasiliensis 5110 TaxID=1398154 RepID=A0A0C2JE95_9PEZI|nr:cecr1 family adenosine deaminase [Sporothrix brasiliensis 5110]KIH95277.1 cecr1 family adenosine deaminase [Sporothrix brasiliensis 5110]
MTFGSDATAPAGSGLDAAAAAAAASAAAPLATPASPPPAAAVKHTNNIQHAPEILQLREAYNVKRHRVADDEAAYAFDHACRVNATQAERLANDVLLRLKKEDQELVFDGAGLQMGYGSQEHAHFAGDHYLTNVPLIQKTKVLQAARKMPKGAHLHIHYNACLAPTVLLGLAAKMDRMFIMSSKKLLFGKEDQETGKMDGSMDDSNFFLSAISFSILAPEKERPGNLFSDEYKENQTMPFRQFLAEFPADKIGKSAMDWLAHKLVFSAEETYDIPQTAAGAWQRFNDRTKMMKGLFNYETAYREYTKLFLQDLLDDNIQYAEIRPNFMTNNQLWNDEGTKQVDNAGIVTIITDACDEFVARNAANFKAGVAGAKKNFDGIKIIYCTPRSFQRTQVRAALAECIEFKKRWPQYIAGFDLVGEEGQGESLNFFVSEFLEFKENCKAEGLDIPFLFHCGETLSIGTSVDGNVVDALLLGAKRIGHGFALPRHPVVLERMKQRNVCVEVCPISNEVLGLTPRISGHAVYDLLARNFPCTVNSDNGTLFQSSLSHDFYQVLVGKADMGLYGWRQLAEWSLTHACFTTPDDLARARAHWLDEWQDFVVWLLQEFDSANPETQAVLRELAGDKTGAAKPAPVEADRSRL